MVSDAKTELEEEISELQQKIDELSSYAHDPKIEKNNHGFPQPD